MTSEENKHKDGGPVFPEMIDVYGQGITQNYKKSSGGLSIRDYFAAKAMQGIVANPDNNVSTSSQEYSAVKQAYRLADAMLAAREIKNV